MKAPNSPPFGLRLRPDSRAFAQDSPGRRLEHRAERGVETGRHEKRSAGRRRIMKERAAFVNYAGSGPFRGLHRPQEFNGSIPDGCMPTRQGLDSLPGRW